MCRTESTVCIHNCTFRKATRRNEFRLECCSCSMFILSYDTNTHTNRPDAIRFIVLRPKTSIESNIICRKKTMCGNWYWALIECRASIFSVVHLHLLKLVGHVVHKQNRIRFRCPPTNRGVVLLAGTFAIIVDSRRIECVVSCAFGDDDYGYCWHERSCAALVSFETKCCGHCWTPNGHQFLESKHIIWWMRSEMTTAATILFGATFAWLCHR